MEDYLTGYENYLTIKKSASLSTLQSYKRDIQQFTEYLNRVGIASYEEVQTQTLKSYAEYLTKIGRSPSTISRFIASLRCFYQYLSIQGVTYVNPAVSFKVAREKRKLPEILTNKEVELLLSQPKQADFKGSRDKAMLEILYATGIRVSELVSLNVRDINCELGILYCRGQETVRMIPIYPAAVKAVNEYLQNFGEILNKCIPASAIFVNISGNRLTRQGFWKIIKIYTEQAGIQKSITPHTLRHSFAAHLLENGADLKSIQEMLGHADISSTQVYAQIVKNRYRDVYNKCHPKA
jgi:Site-specific recombinase XerD